MPKMDLEAMVPEEHRKFIEHLLEKHHVPPLPPGVDAFETLLGWSVSGGRKHVEVALKHPIKLIANALGPPPEDVIQLAHDNDILVAALTGSVSHAVAQKEAGVDIIISSGYEAGGHTGEVGSFVLLPQIVDAVAPTPVLAAGGVGSGRQMAAAMVMGAAGVWTGSIWLTTAESDTVPKLKEKLIAATSRDTIRSKCISGKPARQLVTTYTKAWDAEDSPGTLPMPLQWMATADAQQRIHLYAETGEPGSAELLGSPVGQVVGQMNQVKPAKEVVRELVNGCIDALSHGSELLDLAADEG